MRIFGSESFYLDVPLLSPRSQTRVLQIEPSQQKDNAPVITKLFLMNLNDPPLYEALSYHWGDDTSSETIQVNGCDAQVTGNLASAMRHLRRYESSILLWVDAICINQEDPAEKSPQVAIMHEIYQKARRKVAWIGEGQGDGELALEFLKWYGGRKLLIRPEDVDGRHPDYETKGWAAVMNLMRRPYWRRLWVMQEIALSDSQPYVACGRKRLSWEHLQAALSTEQSAYHFKRLNHVRGATRELLRRQGGNRRYRKGRHIIFLLSHSAGFETSEPRDRVYALFGLFIVAGLVDFTPDYSASVPAVYQQIINYVLTLKGGLDILELKSHTQEPDWPSWVVDFSKSPPFSLPTRPNCLWQRKEDSISESIDRLSLENSISSFSSEYNGLGLEVSGAIVDEIESVAPVHFCVAAAFRQALEAPDAQIFGRVSLRTTNSEALHYWEQREDMKHRGYLCYNVIKYLGNWSTILLSICDNPKDHPDWVPRTWDWIQMLKEAPRCPASQGHPLPDQSTATSSVDVPTVDPCERFNSRYAYALRPILCTLGLMMFGRVCFSTNNGLDGVALTGVREGDKVIAFQSTKQLHVIRSDRTAHEYICAAMLVSPERSEKKKGQVELYTLLAQIRHGEIEDEAFRLE